VRRILIASVAAAAGAVLADPTPSPWFARVESSGIEFENISGRADQIPILDQNGQGAAVLDADGDGMLDLVLVNGSTLEAFRAGRAPGHRLYLNQGGFRFRNRTEASGLRRPLWGTGAAVGDVDRDGRDDLLITGWTPTGGAGGSVALYLSRGGGRFEDATAANGLAAVSGYASGAVFFDAEGDGDLDLFIGRYVDFDPERLPASEPDGSPCLYRGIETGCGPWTYTPQRSLLLVRDGEKFRDVSESSGIAGSSAAGCRAFQSVAFDFDNDHDLDLYVACDVAPNLLFENRSRHVGAGLVPARSAAAQSELRFIERAAELGAAVNAAGTKESGMGIALIEAGPAAAPSLLLTNFAGEKNTLYKNLGGRFEDATAGTGLEAHPAEMGWGVAAEDFDGDGLLDVAIANGQIYPQVAALDDPEDRWEQPLRLYRGLPGGRFEEVPRAGGLASVPPRNRRALIVADLDDDGRPDLIATTHRGRPELFRNVVDRPVRRRPERAVPPDPFRHQGYFSARDSRRFLGWSLAPPSP